MSGIFDIVQKHLPDVHCYADDSQLYLAFNPNCEASQDGAVQAMESCLVDIKKWTKTNCLMLNDDKTEFVIIGTRQQLAKIRFNSISVGNCDINASSSVRNLGAWFDNKFSMESHVTKMCGAAFFHLHNIRRIRKHLSQDATETLVHAFVTSRVDYCNSLLYGLPACQLAKVQRVQNAAARLIFRKSKFCHITPLLKELHWLPINYRIQFKILLITFKALYDMAPIYLSSLISIRSSTRYNLRSNTALVLNIPQVRSHATLGDRSFAMAAPKLWNALPCDIRNAKTLYKFKRLLKTHIFRLAFL